MLSTELGKDIAVIQFDQGSFSKIKTLDCPENIILIFQPPHSPELNPIERYGADGVTSKARMQKE